MYHLNFASFVSFSRCISPTHSAIALRAVSLYSLHLRGRLFSQMKLPLLKKNRPPIVSSVNSLLTVILSQPPIHPRKSPADQVRRIQPVMQAETRIYQMHHSSLIRIFSGKKSTCSGANKQECG